MSSNNSKIRGTHQVGAAASEMLTLEQRIMLDAAAVATGADVVVSDVDLSVVDSNGVSMPLDGSGDDAPKDDGIKDSNQEQTDPAALAVDRQENGVELVFVDTSVINYEALISDLVSNADSSAVGGQPIQVIEITSGSDGISQISTALNQYQNVSAIHIFSHADNGVLLLGNSVLTNTNLDNYATEISGWSDSLTADADILLYGCDLAEGEAGIELVNAIARISGADVAASSDLTGHSSLGGDYVLEYTTGDIEAINPLSQEIMQNWAHALEVSFIASALDSEADNIITPGESVAYSIVVTYSDTDPANSYGRSFTYSFTQPAETVLTSGLLNGGGTSSGIIAEGQLDIPFFLVTNTAVFELDSVVDFGRETQTVFYSYDFSFGATRGSNSSVVSYVVNDAPFDTITILANPELGVESFLTSPSAAPGSVVTHNIQVSNAGNQDSGPVEILTTLPTGLSSADPNWVLVSGNTYQYTPVVAVNGGGGEAQLTFDIAVDSNVPTGFEFADVVTTVSVFEDSLNPGDVGNHLNNTTVSTLQIDASPDLYATLSANSSYLPGDTVVYDILIGNSGNQSASGVEILFEFEGPLTPNIVPGWSFVSGNTYSFDLTTIDDGILSPGESHSLIFEGAMPTLVNPGVESVMTSLSISDDGANGEELTLLNNIDTLDTLLDASPDLTITKVGDVDLVYNADNLTVVYTISVHNTGNQISGGIIIEDFVPVPGFSSINTDLSAPGWSPIIDGVTSYTLPGDFAPGDFLILNLSLDISPSLPTSMTLLDNDVTVSEFQVDPLTLLGISGLDATPGDNAASHDVIYIISNADIFARQWGDYFEAGRGDPAYPYAIAPNYQIVSMATLDDTSNLMGSRQASYYDPNFGYIDYLYEDLQTVRFANYPAINALLHSAISADFPGMSMETVGTSASQMIMQQVDNLSDHVSDDVQDVETDKAAAEAAALVGPDHLNPLMMESANEGGYQTFGQQVDQVANRFDRSSTSLATAMQRLESAA